MQNVVRTINPHISVDCVIFGFSTSQLKVLLIQRDYSDEKGAPAYCACSEKTEGLGTLPATLVEAVISDMKDLLD